MEENSEILSEEVSEEGSEVTMEESSEVMSEDSSEIVILSEVQIPEDIQSKITDLHLVGIMGLAMFGTMFFLWVFDFLYKKLAHYF